MTTKLIIGGLIVASLWALGPVLQKIVLNKGIRSSTILVIGTICTIMATTAFVFFKRHEIFEDYEKLDAHSVILIAVSAVICGLFSSVIFLELMTHYETRLVHALTQLTPVFMLLFTLFILGESVTLQGYLGSFLIFVGCLVVVTAS
jgi:uncharacterized membrane protein